MYAMVCSSQVICTLVVTVTSYTSTDIDSIQGIILLYWDSLHWPYSGQTSFVKFWGHFCSLHQVGTAKKNGRKYIIKSNDHYIHSIASWYTLYVANYIYYELSIVKTAFNNWNIKLFCLDNAWTMLGQCKQFYIVTTYYFRSPWTAV